MLKWHPNKQGAILPIRIPIKTKYVIENVVALNWLAEHSETPVETTRRIWEFVTNDWRKEAVLQLVPEHHVNWYRIWQMTVDGHYEREKLAKGDRWTYRSYIQYYSNSNEIDIVSNDTYVEFMDDTLAVQFKLSNDV
jgi:hypothetical protein